MGSYLVEIEAKKFAAHPGMKIDNANLKVAILFRAHGGGDFIEFHLRSIGPGQTLVFLFLLLSRTFEHISPTIQAQQAPPGENVTPVSMGAIRIIFFSLS